MEDNKINKPLLAFGIVGLIVSVRVLYNLKFGEKKLTVQQNEDTSQSLDVDNNSTIQGKQYRVS